MGWVIAKCYSLQRRWFCVLFVFGRTDGSSSLIDSHIVESRTEPYTRTGTWFVHPTDDTKTKRCLLQLLKYLKKQIYICI